MADRRTTLAAGLAGLALLAACTAPTPPGPSPTVASSPAAASPTSEPTPAVTASPTAGFASTITPIDDALAARMTSSWRPGCPTALADLRYVTVTYRGFDGADHTGELVVSAEVAADVVDVFARLHETAFPIASMRLVDDFGGSDDASMAADNTSAFNCRAVTGGTGFSEHARGEAIDLNPRENPYVDGALVLPPSGAAFLDRPAAPGVIHADDHVVRAFAAIGWSWGGSWDGPVDYQHFSRSGR